jgi:hypothetical protein
MSDLYQIDDTQRGLAERERPIGAKQRAGAGVPRSERRPIKSDPFAVSGKRLPSEVVEALKPGHRLVVQSHYEPPKPGESVVRGFNQYSVYGSDGTLVMDHYEPTADTIKPTKAQLTSASRAERAIDLSARGLDLSPRDKARLPPYLGGTRGIEPKPRPKRRRKLTGEPRTANAKEYTRQLLRDREREIEKAKDEQRPNFTPDAIKGGEFFAKLIARREFRVRLLGEPGQARQKRMIADYERRVVADYRRVLDLVSDPEDGYRFYRLLLGDLGRYKPSVARRVRDLLYEGREKGKLDSDAAADLYQLLRREAQEVLTQDRWGTRNWSGMAIGSCKNPRSLWICVLWAPNRLGDDGSTLQRAFEATRPFSGG